MFTVMRFVAPDGVGEGEIYRLGADLNSLVTGAFTQPDKVPGRFSVTVAADGQWADHDAKLIAFLDVAQPVVRSAAASGYVLECDALVEPEDLAGVAYLNVTPSPQLMQRFVSDRIALNITVCGRPVTDDGEQGGVPRPPRPGEGP